MSLHTAQTMSINTSFLKDLTSLVKSNLMTRLQRHIDDVIDRSVQYEPEVEERLVVWRRS